VNKRAENWPSKRTKRGSVAHVKKNNHRHYWWGSSHYRGMEEGKTTPTALGSTALTNTVKIPGWGLERRKTSKKRPRETPCRKITPGQERNTGKGQSSWKKGKRKET